MIPKIIHWCWLSGDSLPPKIEACVKSWKDIMPDYKIKCWTTNEFDVNSVLYVKQAYEQKKWAFCADFIRAYALFNEGGIYLDSDVLVLKPFDSILNYNFVTSIEFIPDNVALFDIETKCLDSNKNRLDSVSFVQGIGIQAAIMGSVKGLPYLKDCLEYYSKIEFRIGKGYDNLAIVAPNIYALCAEKYGFKYENKDQLIDNKMMIFKDEVFCIPEFKNKRTLALHLVAHSWYEPTIKQKLYTEISKNIFLKKVFEYFEKKKVTKGIIAIIKKFVWIK